MGGAAGRLPAHPGTTGAGTPPSTARGSAPAERGAPGLPAPAVGDAPRVPRTISSGYRGQPGSGLWSPGAFLPCPSPGVRALRFGAKRFGAGQGCQAVPGRGAREERGTPGLMPAVDVAWRAQISRFSCWERGAAVPGVARPDEVRRCRFTPYGSSQPSSGQPGAGQPRRDSGQQSRGVPESRHASARHLVPSAVPCHRRGWPGAPCQEGDSVSEVLPPALCNPQGAACRGRSGQGSAHTGSPKGKVGQPSPAAARVTRLQLHRSLSPSFPPGSGVKRMLLRTRRRCAQIWGKGGFEKPPLAP